jgi:hypothetical protein
MARSRNKQIPNVHVRTAVDGRHEIDLICSVTQETRPAKIARAGGGSFEIHNQIATRIISCAMRPASLIGGSWMDNSNLVDMHIWLERISRQFKQEGKTILLRQCSLCRRDFAQGLDGSDWRPVYVGIFRVELLAKAASERWLNERCPGKQLPDDDVVRGLARVQQKPITVGSTLSRSIPPKSN